MENEPIQCKDPFSKTVADACRVLVVWKNRYGSRENKMTDTNDGVAFAIRGRKQQKEQKKEITCYKCKKTGHYSNECDKEESV